MLLLRPFLPMGWVHLDGSLQFRVYPGIANAATGKDQRMHLPAGVNYREPHIPVVWNIASGVDQMPHSGCQACEPEIRFDLAQEPSDNVGQPWTASSDAKTSSIIGSFLRP